MTERDLLVDCLQRLNRSGLSYMLTGSMASNFWGIPRTTHDIHFVLQLPPSSVTAIVQVFSGDFHVDESAIRAAFQPPYQFNAIDHRSGLKVDFWLPAPTAFDRERFRRRLPRKVFGVSAWIATAEDVILHKLYWRSLTPSERQLGDAVGVIAVQQEALDLDYLRRWATELGVDPVLNQILEGRIRPKTT